MAKVLQLFGSKKLQLPFQFSNPEHRDQTPLLDSEANKHTRYEITQKVFVNHIQPLEAMQNALKKSIKELKKHNQQNECENVDLANAIKNIRDDANNLISACQESVFEHEQIKDEDLLYRRVFVLVVSASSRSWLEGYITNITRFEINGYTRWTIAYNSQGMMTTSESYIVQAGKLK